MKRGHERRAVLAIDERCVRNIRNLCSIGRIGERSSSVNAKHLMYKERSAVLAQNEKNCVVNGVLNGLGKIQDRVFEQEF